MRLLESQRGDSCRGSGYPELLGPGRRTCSLPKGAGAALLLLLSLSVMSTLATPWTVAQQAPLPMEFFRQEYWSGLPFPSPGDLPDSGTESASPALSGRFFTTEPPGKPRGMKVKSESEVAQLCPTPSNPMDCSLPGSPVHGIFQARILEIPSSG